MLLYAQDEIGYLSDAVIAEVAERIGIMSGGRLIAEGTMEELRSHSGRAGGSLEDIFLQLVAEEKIPT